MLINDVIVGNTAIDDKLAAIFGRELGLPTDLWLRMEARYHGELAHQKAAEAAAGFAPWAKAFPRREMVKRGIIEKPRSDVDEVLKLLNFFGVASVAEWQRQYDAAQVAYRHSSTFAGDEFNLAVWLRQGELEAEWQRCNAYDAEKFQAALSKMRLLTREPAEVALDKLFDLCNQSGVALALVPPFAKAAVSGATRWLPHNRPLIQLSRRHKTNDQLWFTLFHEAAHVLLHSREQVFIDTMKDEIAGLTPKPTSGRRTFSSLAWTGIALPTPGILGSGPCVNLPTPRVLRRR